MEKVMNAKALKALSVVCLHTTMPLVEQQAQEIKKLKQQLKDLRKARSKWMNICEYMENFGYDEDFDKEMIREGEDPYFRPREDYDDDEIW